jgi:hypothetical protein
MKKKLNLKRIICCALCLLIVPICLAVFTFGLPPQYDLTFFGGMSIKTQRLASVQGKKIIVVGGSSVAFGLKTEPAERELSGYKVVNFGLYASIGSKAMLQLCADYISRGDIVIFSPELNKQTLSDYFGAESIWKAIDGDFGSISCFDFEDRKRLLGTFPEFAASKMKYFLKGKPEPDGVYVRDSFDTYGDICCAKRSNNIMPGGFDAAMPVDFSVKINASFAEWLNDYNKKISKKGATMYWRLCPVNALSVSSGTADKFYDALNDEIDFAILGNPNDCVMEPEWFFDTNFHLNDAGAILNTANLVCDLKIQLSDSSPTNIEIPEKPPLAEQNTDGDFDNSCDEMFVYEEEKDGLIISGLTESGKQAKELTLPGEVDGKKVKGIKPSVFKNNDKAESITVQKNISALYDGTFYGCTRLKRILIKARPRDIAVGQKLLDGTSANIFVPKDVLDGFKTDYSWSLYSSRIYGI